MSFRVMRVYSTHTKKKAYSVSKMTSGSAGEGEVSVTHYAVHFILSLILEPLSFSQVNIELCE